MFYGAAGGIVYVGSHVGKLRELVGASLDSDWLAARLLVPSASDMWWTGSPWRGVRTVRPGWSLHLGAHGVTVAPYLDLAPPSADLAVGGQALRKALCQAVTARSFDRSAPSIFNDASADMYDDDTGFRCVASFDAFMI